MLRSHINLQNLRRLWLTFIALPISSLGVCLFTMAGFGNDPFTGMNMGLSKLVGLSFGVWQMMLNAALLVLVFLFARYLIGIATLMNMTLIGLFVDLFLPPVTAVFPAQPAMPLRVVSLLGGVVLVSLGASLYSKTKLGVSPYDATGFILTQKTGWKFQWCRMITDAVVTLAAVCSGSVVGVGTVITAFFMGPLIAWFNVHLCDKLLHMDEFEDFWMSNSLIRAVREPEEAQPRMEAAADPAGYPATPATEQGLE